MRGEQAHHGLLGAPEALVQEERADRGLEGVPGTLVSCRAPHLPPPRCGCWATAFGCWRLTSLLRMRVRKPSWSG